MKVERIFLVRLSDDEHRRLVETGELTVDEGRNKRGFVEIRVRANSDDARRLEDELDDSGVEYYIRDERTFSRKEIRSAHAIHLEPARRDVECKPSERGTYDWSEVCDQCQRVPVQVGPIKVAAHQLGDARIARGRRGELLIREEIATRMIKDGISGCLLREVFYDDAGGLSSAPWFQVTPMRALPVAASPPTRFASSDEVCPSCGRGGLHLCSMLYYAASIDAFEDLNVTRELFGEGPSLAPEIIVSPRFYNLLIAGGAELAETEPVLFV